MDESTLSQSDVSQSQGRAWQPFIRWLLLLAALSGALWTQSRIGQFDPAWVAGLFFLVFGTIVALAAPGPLSGAPALGGRLRWLGTRPAWIGGGAALFLALGAAVLLWNTLSNWLGLLFWLAAMVVLCAAFWSLRPVAVDEDRIRTWFPAARQPSRFSIPWQWEIAFLLLILAGALVVRVWDIPLFPNGLQSDEGNNGMEALKWLSGAPYTPYSEANEGQASLFTYLIALAFSLAGPSVEAMRIVSALVGVATVLAFHLLARDHLTAPAALAGTALLAFSRWHITFSRIVYELILTPLAVVLLFYFLHRGLRDRRARDFVLAGLALAFGFNTYTGFRTVPIGVGLLFLYWLITRRRQIGLTIRGGLLMVGSALVGLIPLAIYILQKPDVILLRTRRLNLLGEIDAVGSLQPLWTNLRNYTLMFNLHGDPVPINNLPGAPALGTIVAALAVVGLVYALRHLWEPRLFLAVAWIVATLPAGILSVTLESPSSRRVIGILPLAYLLAATALDLFWRQSVRAWQGYGRWLGGLVMAGVVVAAGYANVNFFFTRQAAAEPVKMAFSPVESGIARYIAGLDHQAILYLNQNFRSHSAIQLIAHNPDYIVFDPALHLPLPAPYDKPVIYILSLDDERLRFIFEQFYPAGVWEQHTTEFGAPIFNTFTVSPQQQMAATGLLARISPPGDWQNPTGPPVRTDGVELPPLPSQGAGVVWSGSLRVPVHGVYIFRIAGVKAASLRIDGEERFVGSLSGAVELAGGFHDFVAAADVSGQARPLLFWRGPAPEQPVPLTAFYTFPAPPFGLTGVYYPNATWQGEPVLVQRDIVVASTDVLLSPYSVVWTGEIAVDVAGPTVFGTTSDDGSFVYVDGQLAVDNGGQHGAEYREGPPLELSAGRHTIEIRYFQDGGSHRFELFWTQPGRGRQLVAPDHLFASGPVPAQPAVEAPASPAPVEHAPLSPLPTSVSQSGPFSPLPTGTPTTP